MMGVVDALCSECGKPIRWSPGTPRVCSMECYLGEKPQPLDDVAAEAAILEAERIVRGQ